MEVKIKNNNEMMDATIEMVDGVMVVSPKEVKFEPKDGDVVYSGGFYEFVFIYKDNLTAEAYYYVSLFLKDNKLELPDGGHIGYVNQLRPATEEEKKLLFDKIDEEGYEWLADKRELIQKRWKPKFNEEYFVPSFTIADRFSPCIFTFIYHELDYDYISRGWAFPNEDKCQQFCDKLNQAINSIKP